MNPLVNTISGRLSLRPHMEDAEVRDKSRAAVEWCRHATDHERRHDGKPWRYLLIPHDAVEANRTLAGLAAQFSVM